ncbi:MAG: hypothetical protein KDA89_16300, partial [Planctomycetaceae bacterium]|nr:hypothetical protein [Planctomycetaceae bacterium]
RLLQSDERRVPLSFRWIVDQLLPEQLEIMADGDDESRYTPALVFCFNRSECWNVAEQIKGRRLLADGQQKQLQAELDRMDLSVGAGGKLRQILIRGVGIHHAGLLPKYRRMVESLFQKKLLSICVCTETLAAGINLPARSVVMTSLLKGPPGALKLIDPSSAHQMFGRAGRPQFDNQGYVFTVAHEDDVRLHRWQEKYDQIPEDTKDPLLLRAKKNLKKKMPKRRPGQQYWTEKQFETLQTAPPGNLSSRGRFPWRLLAYLVRKSGSVFSLTMAVRKRLLTAEEMNDGEKSLKRMLVTLDAGGFVRLDPPPPRRQRANIVAENDEGTGKNEPAADDGPFRSRLAGSGTEFHPEAVQAGRSVSTSVWGRGLTQEEDDYGGVIDFSAQETQVGEDFGSGIFEDDESAADETDSGSLQLRAEDTITATPETPNASGREETTSETTDDDNTRSDNAASAEVRTAPGLLGQLIQEARQSGTASTSDPQSQRKLSPGTKAKPEDAAHHLDAYEPQYAFATSQLDLLFAFRSINSLYAVFLAELMHRADYEERLQLLEAALDMPGSVAKYVRVPFPDAMPPGPLATEYLNGQLLSSGLVTPDELTGYRDEVLGKRIPPLTLAAKAHLLFRNEFPGVHDARSSPVWCVGDLLKFNGDF